MDESSMNKLQGFAARKANLHAFGAKISAADDRKSGELTYSEQVMKRFEDANARRMLDGHAPMGIIAFMQADKQEHSELYEKADSERDPSGRTPESQRVEKIMTARASVERDLLAKSAPMSPLPHPLARPKRDFRSCVVRNERGQRLEGDARLDVFRSGRDSGKWPGWARVEDSSNTPLAPAEVSFSGLP